MEIRKQKEIEYYDKKAEEGQEGDFEGFNPSSLSSYRFCYDWLLKNCQDKEVLDYGCGNGVHSVFLAKQGAKMVGIDLSEPLLRIAKERAKKEGVGGRAEFLLMDCEELKFPNNSFDVIFDGGTFSSLDVKKAYPELARVLKPTGFLVGIETFGHNPLTNLKRKINKLRGKRTKWAAEHILRTKDIDLAKNYFHRVEIRFFHLVSWIIFPFLNMRGAKFLLKFLEAIDKILFGLPFLRKYAFKVVFILSSPIK